MFFGIERSCCCGGDENLCTQCIYKCIAGGCSGETTSVYVPCNGGVCPDASQITISCDSDFGGGTEVCGAPNIIPQPSPPECVECP